MIRDVGLISVRDLSIDEFHRSLANPSRVLEGTAFCHRKRISVIEITALASHVSAYVAARAGFTASEVDDMSDAEFLAAAQPLLDFLNSRWPPG